MELQFHDVAKRYGAKEALRGIDLTLTPGVYGLLGPNGAGKSTLMNILTGNLRPTRGRVTLDGQDTVSMGEAFRRRLGYCPQQQALYPGFTGEQFLYYMASLQGMSREDAKERMDWALARLDLTEAAGRPIRGWSGGMKQRLLLAQALLHDPDILVLDEPTAGLDPRQRVAVRNLSLWQLADGQALCREAVYLNLLGSPSDRVLLGAIFLTALAVIAGIGGAALYAQTPGGSGKWVAFTRSLPRPRHTCLAGHELYKALISRCGLWILLAFFAVIALLYGRFTPERSEFEVYYRNYSEFLSGAPSQEKDAYLASEQARFDELNEQLVELGRRYPDSVTFDREAEPIRNQLHAEDAFHMAQNQYRALRPGQVYLYQTGYQRLLGADALRQDVLELGGAFLAVALLLFGSFAGERESGVDALLTASPRRRSVVRWKCAIAGGYVLLLTLALWLPGLLTVQGAYGQLNMAAQANSVQCLSILSDGWTVGGVVLLLLASRLLLLAASAAAVMLLSRRCAMVPALLLSLLLLLLPVGAAYAWM